MKREDMKNDKFYYLVDACRVLRVTTQDVRRVDEIALEWDLFETQEEAMERLLEVLGLKLHQLEDDKEGILYNIKELKKKIKNPKKCIIFKETK